MFFAVDSNNNRVHIDDTLPNVEYFCPSCGGKLIIRKGNINAHHFAHYAKSACGDSWHYDMSLWHSNWQNRFPKNCQEIVKQKDGKKHRADVLIENCKIVIEFQHSPLDENEFKDRNNFFVSLGYKVVWIFDLTEAYEEENLYFLNEKAMEWKRPKRTFGSYDDLNGNVILYFQIENIPVDDLLFLEIEKNINSGVSLLPENRDYYFDHKDLKGKIIRVNKFSRYEFLIVNIEKNELSTEEFLLLFANYIDMDIKVDIHEIYDKLQFLSSEDHTSYYFGCPISKTHKCANSLIDLKESQYEEIAPCPKCKYRGSEIMTCRKRIVDLNIPEGAKIKSYRRDKDGFVDLISYLYGGKLIKIKPKPLEFKSILYSLFELWDENQMSMATFKNINTGYFVRINSNPSTMYFKYGKCYGKISKDQYSFKGESVEIYGVFKKEWILVWKK